jgi:hypothetical protein
MAVEVTLARQHSYHFNESRLERVLTAKTLDDASKMGLLDSVIDWFRGGVKYEAIQSLYQQIAQPSELTPAQVAQRFAALRQLVVEPQQSKFVLHLRDEGEHWRMALSIDSQCIYLTPSLDIDSQFYQAAAVKTAITAKDDLHKMASALTLDKYVEGNIQCMSDDKQVQQTLRQSLDNPRFSAQYFVGMAPHETDPAKFIAIFSDELGDTRWAFSNRAATNGELRAELLKAALSSGHYPNLGTLLATGFMGDSDNSLRYAVTPARYELLGLVTHAGMADEGLARVLYQAKVGNTSLGALFNLPAPAETVQQGDMDDFMLCDDDISLVGQLNDVYADEAQFYQGIGQHKTTTAGDHCFDLMSQNLDEGLQYLATKVNPHKLQGGVQNTFDYLVGRNSGAIALRNCITCAKAVDANMGLMLARQQDSHTELKLWEAIDTREGVIAQHTAQSQTLGLSAEQTVSALLLGALPLGQRAIVSVPVSGSPSSHAMNLFHFDKCYVVDGQNGNTYDLSDPKSVADFDRQYNAKGRDIAPITLHGCGSLPRF